MPEEKKFHQKVLERALKYLKGFTTPGGFVGPKSVALHPTYFLAWIGGKDITPTGPKTPALEAATSQLEAPPTTGFMLTPTGGMSIAPPGIFRVATKTTDTTKTIGAPETKTTTVKTDTIPKAGITEIKTAPDIKITPTPPPPTPPAVAGGATRAITPPPTAGFEAPRLASLPPAPTPIAERGAFVGTPPTIPETPLGQFEAMIRALQQLTQARYLPRPLEGALAFGPAGALERALKRLRERELGISPT